MAVGGTAAAHDRPRCRERRVGGKEGQDIGTSKQETETEEHPAWCPQREHLYGEMHRSFGPRWSMTPL